MKIYRILGQKGRITIPLAIRLRCGFAADDVLSFESVEAFLDSLTPEEKKRALLHLWEGKTN